MAQIQGADQHFIPRVDHYNQSGQIMSKGLADFGAGLGAAVNAYTVKQEEARAEKQRSEGVADLLMQFYPGQFKDRAAAVKMAKDPEVTNAFFKFSQQQANASAAAAKQRQEAAQKSFENSQKLAESQRAYQKLLSDTANTESLIQDRQADNALNLKEFLLEKTKFEQGGGNDGPAELKVIEGLIARHNKAVAEGDPNAVYYKGALDKKTLPSGSKLVVGADGTVTMSTGTGLENTTAQASRLQAKNVELTNGIALLEGLDGRVTSENFGVPGFLKETFIDKSLLADFGFDNPERVDARFVMRSAVETAKKALAADSRISDTDNKRLDAMLPNINTVWNSAAATEQARKTTIRVMKMQRALNNAMSIMGPVASTLSPEQIKELEMTPDDKAHLAMFLHPDIFKTNN